MPHAVFLDMDDTLLDSSGGAEESWKLACATFAPHLGIAPEQLRLAIRKAAQEFWKDEAVSGHWRVKLKESRVMFVENALREEKLKQQVQELKIVLDEARQTRKVAEITETEYFKSLQSEAELLRSIVSGTTNLADQ